MRRISVPKPKPDPKVCPGSGTDVSMTRSGTKPCAVCGRVYKITKDGKLWRHTIGTPHWGEPSKCHRKHSRSKRCAWCGLVKR